jgi:hypothetical protein
MGSTNESCGGLITKTNKNKKTKNFNIHRNSALEIDEENAAYHKRSSSKHYFSHILLQTASKFKEKKKQKKTKRIDYLLL